MGYPFSLVKWLVRTGLAKWLPSVQRRTDGAGDYLHHYSDRVLAALDLDVGAALGMREPASRDVIDLSQGSPLFDLLPSATTKLPADRRGLLPAWGLPELLAAVAAKLHDDLGPAFPPSDEILITAGVSGAFHLVLDAFINPGDAVVLFDPSSYRYSFALRQRRARIRWVPTWLEDGRTCFHIEALARALRGAKLIVVNTPNNPTGGILLPEDLEAIAWWAARHDVLIFSDEVFERFQYEGERTSIAQMPKTEGRTLIAGSVSKGHALASARVGWLAGHRHLVRPCTLTAAIQGACVPTLCQQQAATALRQGDEVFRPIRDEFDARRRYVHHRLEAMGLQPDWPAGAFFFWVPVGIFGLTGQQFAERLLAEQQVVVWPGQYFGPNGSQHIRISYCGDEGRLREGLGRLEQFVDQLHARLETEQRRLKLLVQV